MCVHYPTGHVKVMKSEVVIKLHQVPQFRWSGVFCANNVASAWCCDLLTSDQSWCCDVLGRQAATGLSDIYLLVAGLSCDQQSSPLLAAVLACCDLVLDTNRR